MICAAAAFLGVFFTEVWVWASEISFQQDISPGLKPDTAAYVLNMTVVNEEN